MTDEFVELGGRCVAPEQLRKGIGKRAGELKSVLSPTVEFRVERQKNFDFIHCETLKCCFLTASVTYFKVNIGSVLEGWYVSL